MHGWLVGWLYRVHRPTRKFFTQMETISGEGLQILTYARHLWLLSSKVLQRATPTETRAYRL